jgi:hypothetical protein
VPAGDRTVVVTYLGRKDEIVETKVVAGATARLDVKMSMVAFEESVTVTAEALILESQERALNVQKAAANITNVVSADLIGSFPDRNAAETTQRIPCSVDYQGPGRGPLRQHPRHRAAAQRDDDRRPAHSVARSADSPGCSRRGSLRAAPIDRSVESADARTWTATRSAAA